MERMQTLAGHLTLVEINPPIISYAMVRTRQLVHHQNSDVFDHLKLAPPDVILGTTTAYKKDTDPNKVSLGVGAYRDDNEKPYVFDVVKKAQREIVEENLDKVYKPNTDLYFNRNIYLSRVMLVLIKLLRSSFLEKIIHYLRKEKLDYTIHSILR